VAHWAIQVLEVIKVLKELLDHKVLQEMSDYLEEPVILDRLVLLVFLAMLEVQALLELVGQLELLDSQEILVPQGRLAYRVPSEIPVSLEPQDSRATLEALDLKDQGVIKVSKDNKDNQEQMAYQELQVLSEQQVVQELLVVKDRVDYLVNRVPKDLLVTKGRLVQQASQVLLEVQEYLDQLDPLVRLDQVVTLVTRVPLDLLEPLDHKDQLVVLDLQVCRV
jgi:hypothetical protein